MEVQWGNDELGAHGCCWLCGFGDGGAQCAPISSTHQNFVLVILPLGREKKAKSYPKNWEVEGHKGCTWGSQWMQGEGWGSVLGSLWVKELWGGGGGFQVHLWGSGGGL